MLKSKQKVVKAWVIIHEGKVDTDEVKTWTWKNRRKPRCLHEGSYQTFTYLYMIFESIQQAKHYLKTAWGCSSCRKEYTIAPCEISYKL